MKICEGVEEEVKYCPRCNTKIRNEYKTTKMKFKIVQVEHGIDLLTVIHVYPVDKTLHSYTVGKRLEGLELELEVKVPFDFKEKE